MTESEAENNVYRQLQEDRLREARQGPKDAKMDFVHIGNYNWNLVLHMLFGIRQSVVTAKNDDVYDLSESDFSDKRAYVINGMSN